MTMSAPASTQSGTTATSWPARRQHSFMLGVGRPDDGDPRCRHQARQELDQRLRAGRGDDGRGIARRRSGAPRRRAAPARPRARQAGPVSRRQVGHGIGDGIDAGRQIDPGLRRVGNRRRTSPRSPPCATGFGAAGPVIGTSAMFARSRPRCRRDRSDHRISGRRLSLDRPSRDLDRPAHSMVRRGVEFADARRSSSGAGAASHARRCCWPSPSLVGPA